MATVANADELRRAVAAKYGEVAANPGGKHPFPVGRKFAVSIGYPEEVLRTFQDAVTESFAGVGTPVLEAGLRRGMKVLDLGCGAGLDCLLARQSIGPDGLVVGVDMAPEMLHKARRNLRQLRCGGVPLLRAYAEELPFATASFDVVVSNGIFNLAPLKDFIFAEIYRILKPGGHVTASEIVLEHALDTTPQTLTDWFR